MSDDTRKQIDDKIGGDKIAPMADAPTNDKPAVLPYLLLCDCDQEVPFALETTDVVCPNCQAHITVTALSPEDATRQTAAQTAATFLTTIFSFRATGDFDYFNKRKNGFSTYIRNIYQNHLHARATQRAANNAVHFILNYENRYVIRHGPHDIRTEDGFFGYYNHWITSRTSTHIFTPELIGIDQVFRITTPGTTYNVVHCAVKISNVSSGALALMCPSTIHSEILLRVICTGGNWWLLDGQSVFINVKDVTKEKSGNAKSGCFIATVAFGNTECPELQSLRVFRDEVLLRHAAGRRFVASYYKYGPAAAATIGRSAITRSLVRAALRLFITFCTPVLGQKR